jgi:beta-galactosidase
MSTSRKKAIHMAQLKMIIEMHYIWGSFAWNMFDFGANHKKEADTSNLNPKGLITYDR